MERTVSRTARGGKSRPLALLAVAVTVAIWGLSSVAIKLVSSGAIVASFYRLWFAIALLWLIPALAPPVRRRFDRKWLVACLVGGGLFGVHQIFFFNSLELTSVANVTIIGALQPALVLLIAGRMFGERVTLRAVMWSLVALAGVVVVIVGSAGAPGWNPFGDAVAVGNLLAFTAYFLASKQIRTHIGATEYMVGMTSVAGIMLLLTALATGQDLGALRGWDWLILLGVAIFPGTLGHFLINWAHPHTSAFVVSMMLLAVPVIASVAAAVFLGEVLGLPQIVGGTIVLLAIGTIVRLAAAETGEQLAEGAAETDAP